MRPLIALLQSDLQVPWTAEARRAGYDVKAFQVVPSLLDQYWRFPVGLVVVSDLGGGAGAQLDAARKVRAVSPSVPILLLATDSSESCAIAALRIGINEYVKLPATADQILEAVAGLLTPTAASSSSGRNHQLVGDSPAVRSVFAYATQVAQTNSTMLITGETGTGKDLVAELIHSMSARRSCPFVALNCAAIPDSLLESELFGRERGAYTGADTAYEGKLKLADGGTVLLDEIGDLTPFGQAKLLRVVENRQAQRLGSAKEIPLNIRILAATNQDLAAMVEKGQFRRDLYFRLTVTRLELPPLRARKVDVPALLQHFAETFERTLGLRFPGFTGRALSALTEYHWPGNIRQLRNVVEELFVRLPNRPLDMDDLPADFVGPQSVPDAELVDEKTRIISALASTRWNKKRAAERLSWSRMTLYRKMAFYHIEDGSHSAVAPPSQGAALAARIGG